jgi:hypothetical protein
MTPRHQYPKKNKRFSVGRGSCMTAGSGCASRRSAKPYRQQQLEQEINKRGIGSASREAAEHLVPAVVLAVARIHPLRTTPRRKPQTLYLTTHALEVHAAGLAIPSGKGRGVSHGRFFASHTSHGLTNLTIQSFNRRESRIQSWIEMLPRTRLQDSGQTNRRTHS